MRRYVARPYDLNRYLLAEGPAWDERTGILSYVDITAGKMYLLRPGREKQEIEFGQMIGAAVPAAAPGTYVAALRDCLMLVDRDDRKKLIDLTDYYEPWQRSNDAKIDPAGRLFFGSITCEDGKPSCGNLYCFDSSGVRVLQADTKLSNGMAWSADATKFFFSDSLENAVFVYDYDMVTGNIANRRLLFEVTDDVPDGMCIDANDNLWVAVWGGHRVECHDSVTGEMLAVIDVPAKNVTSCCFVGPEQDTLFITTSGDGLEGEYDGCLFTCRVEE